MYKTLVGLGLIAIVVIGIQYVSPTGIDALPEDTTMNGSAPSIDDMPIETRATDEIPEQFNTALLAGGCFWCVEADLEKLPGVITVISGYAGGTTVNPTYDDYGTDGHREVVLVTYNPTKVTYGQLVEYMLKHADPTDKEGSFGDRGFEYSPAVYFKDTTEESIAREVITHLDSLGVYEESIDVYIEPWTEFYPAEEYHQDYYIKNPLKYGYYRRGSGRTAFIEKHWGNTVDSFVVPINTNTTLSDDWKNFVKPTDAELRVRLTSEQYHITQEQGTERAFHNEYYDNTEPGLYVDVVSGEPLFSSTHKFDSGTGWPSFTQPIDSRQVTLHEDNRFFLQRIEVRSAIADSHLGHVFNDAPPELGGIRYCMNSAALRFVPIADLVSEGYGEYSYLFEE